MKAAIRPLLAAVLACALAACHAPDTLMADGAIKLYGDVVALHVDGSPDADITADGSLLIDDKAVATTPAERDLLVRYNRGVRAVREAGLAMGKAGIETAAKAVVGAASSTTGQADTAGRRDAGPWQELTLRICRATAAIEQAQDQLASQLTAFRPYASIIGAHDAADCVKDAQD